MKTEDVKVLSLVENEFKARFTHPRSISLGRMGDAAPGPSHCKSNTKD